MFFMGSFSGNGFCNCINFVTILIINVNIVNFHI